MGWLEVLASCHRRNDAFVSGIGIEGILMLGLGSLQIAVVMALGP